MANPGSVHEQAVSILERALYGAYGPGLRARFTESPVFARLRPGHDEFSGDLAEGAVRVNVPSEWDSVGGIVPDLILYGQDGEPRRIIEVVVTSKPSAGKREKLERIIRRGVDVVEVEVHTDDDLLKLLKGPGTPAFGRKLRSVEPGRYGVNQQAQEQLVRPADKAVEEMITAIVNCTPYQRGRLAAVLNSLNTIDSLYPHPVNL